MLHPSHNHSLADRINEWVHQPIFFAALVSVGLHGVLFAALPSFSVDNSSLDDQRTVPVVELETEEIVRLPGFVELDDPLIPDANDAYDLGLPPLDTFLNDLDTANSADDFDIEDFAPLPAPVAPPPTYTSPLLLPSSPPIFNPAPVSPSSGWLSTPVQPTPIQPTPIQPTPVQPTDPESDLNNTDSGPEVGTEPNPVDPSATNPPGDEDPNPANTDPANNDPANTPNNPQNIAAQPLSDEDRIKRLLEEFEEKRQSVDVASGLASVTEIDQWLKTSPENLRAIELNPAYPREACASYRQNVEGIWIGVLVDENNQIATSEEFAPNPQILISSGSEFFDNQAKEAVTAITFEEQELANQLASYTVTVNFTFKEEDCPSIFNEMDDAVNNSSPETTDSPSSGGSGDDGGQQNSEATPPVSE
ncbi:MAG: hypothetical protein F6K09_06965 [Merismopedia sp. SIO2A8]|nr:hypothetical protein [Merismopedia sp. SIO2A8]